LAARRRSGRQAPKGRGATFTCDSASFLAGGMAIAHKFDGTSPALAVFWAALHHDAAEPNVPAQASSAAEPAARRAQHLLEAGAAYVRAGETERAAAAFKQAARIEPFKTLPGDPNPDPTKGYRFRQGGVPERAEKRLLTLRRGLKDKKLPWRVAPEKRRHWSRACSFRFAQFGLAGAQARSIARPISARAMA
jgi:hypothetical protein